MISLSTFESNTKLYITYQTVYVKQILRVTNVVCQQREWVFNNNNTSEKFNLGMKIYRGK